MRQFINKSAFFIIGSLVLGSCYALPMPNFYAGASIGHNTYDNTTVPSGITTSTKQTNYGALGGALWKNTNYRYGIELGFTQFDKKKWKNTEKQFTLESNAVHLNGVLRYLVPSLQSLYFELQFGGALVHQETTFKDLLANPALPGIDTQTGSIAGTKTELEPDALLGVGYTFLKHYSAAFYYSRIFANESDAPFLNDGTGGYATKGNFNSISSIENLTFRFTYTF